MPATKKLKAKKPRYHDAHPDDLRRRKGYDSLIKKMQALADSADNEGHAKWEPPDNLSPIRIKWRIRAFVQGDRAPEPPKGWTWHSRLRDGVVKVFLGRPPKRSAGRAARKATRK